MLELLSNHSTSSSSLVSTTPFLEHQPLCARLRDDAGYRRICTNPTDEDRDWFPSWPATNPMGTLRDMARRTIAMDPSSCNI